MNSTMSPQSGYKPTDRSAFFTSTVILLIVLSICIYFSFFRSQAAGVQRRRPPAVGRSPLTLNNKHPEPSKRDQTNMPGTLHTLAASYFSFKDTFTATLMLSNQEPHPMQVSPTLFSMSGEALAVPPIMLEGNTAREFSLKEWVASAGPNFSEGSLQVLYFGGPLQVGGLVKLKDNSRRLAFDEELSELPKDFRSSQLEGVWWLPSQQSEINLAVSNTTAAALTAVIRLDGAEDRLPVKLALSPHESHLLNIQKLICDEEGEVRRIGGISIKHNGPRGALLARGMVQDSATSYSSVVEFSDPQKAKMSRLDGAGLSIGNVFGENLDQIAVVRNVGSDSTTVTGRIPYTLSNGRVGVIDIPELHLLPGKVKEVNLTRLIGPPKLRSKIRTAGLEFNYTCAARQCCCVRSKPE
jgi:hypothetical protein